MASLTERLRKAAEKERKEKEQNKAEAKAPSKKEEPESGGSLTERLRKASAKERGVEYVEKRTAGASPASSNQTTSAPRTSYIERARNATEANIATGNTMSQAERETRRTELENQLSELQTQKDTLHRYIVGARRGNASKLVTKYSAQMSDVENQIRELEAQLREVEMPEYISRADQLEMLEEEQKAARNAARQATAQYSGSAGGRALASLMQRDPEAAKEMFSLAAETQGVLDETRREQAWIDYLNKYSDHTHEDTFGGQFGANFRMGKFGEDTNKAFGRYLTTGSEADRDYAMALQELEQDYAARNAGVLDDEGAKAKWITQTAAGYLPQAWNNLKAEAIGGGLGALAGIAVGNPVTGAKVGAVAASGVESYSKMRGATYRNLIAAGMDEESARAAANDEAFISTLIEMGDTAIDMLTLGGGKALNALGSAALKSGSKNAAVKSVAKLFSKEATEKLAKTAAKEAGKSFGRKALETVGGVALNAAGEYVEEALQEGVSIANQEREGSGVGNLIGETTKTLGGALSGEDKESRARIHEAGTEGFKIGLMFGGTRATTNTVIQRMANAKTKAQQDALVESIRSDEESLTALVQEGKDSGEGSVSAKIATEIEQKLQKGEEVTAKDVKRLIASNEVYIEAEEKKAQQAETEKRRIDTKETTGYGEYGSRAFTEIVEDSRKSPDEVRVEFQSAYEAGLANLPRERASLVTNVQESAYNAGRRDAIMSMKKAEVKGATVWGKEGGLAENEHSAKLDGQTRTTLQSMGKATGTKIIVEEIPAELNANGYYKDSDGTIHIDVNTEQPVMTVVKHELTHRMQSLAPKEYERFRNYAVQALSAELGYGNLTPVEAIQQDYFERSNGQVQLSTEEAMDEIAANFTEKILTDEKALHDFATNAAKNEDTRTMAQKFFDAVREFIKKIKAAFKGDKVKMDQAAKEQYGTTIDQLERAERLWKETYTAATKAAQGLENSGEQAYTGSENDGTKYALKDVQKKFQRAFTGSVTSDESIELSNREKVAISHALKTGFGRIDVDGKSGSVNTSDYCYMFYVTDNGGARVTKVIDHEMLNIHDSKLGGVYEERRYDHKTGAAAESGRRGSRYGAERVSETERSRQSGADDRMAGAEQSSDSGGNLREVQGDGKRRFSLKESDRVQSGKPVTVYHGSKNDFSEFDFSKLKDELGVFFSADENNSKAYGDVRAFTLAPKKTLVVHQGDEYKRIMMTGETDAEKRARFIREGYDTIKIVYENPNGGETVDWVALKPEVIRSPAEDAKFSLKGQSDLMKENAKLREVNEALKEQFKRTTFAKVDAKKLESFTRQLLRDYNSGADRGEIRKALDDLYVYMANGEDGNTPAWNEVQKRAYEVATDILRDASVVNDDMYQAYAGVRDYLRTTGLKLDPRDESDLGGYESLNEFRKANFGRIKIKKDGLPVNIAYSELAGMYPDLFDEYEYTHPATQLMHMEEVLNSLQPYEENPFSRNMRESATWLANDIIERFYELPQAKPTFADKAERKLTEQKIKDGKKLERVREQKDERIAKLIAQQREKVNRVQTKEREKRAEAVKKLKENQRAKEARMSENRKASVYKERIKKHVARISKMLLNPTETSHVPESMRKPVAGFLEAIDLSPKMTNKDGSTRNVSINTINRLYRLQEAYQSILDKKTDADMEIDPDLIDNISSVISAMGEDGSITVNELSRSDLETLYRVVVAVERSIYSYNRTMNEAMQRNISELGQMAMQENAAEKGYQESSARPKQWAADILNMDMLNPQDFFMQSGETMDLLFHEIRRGFDTKIRNTAVAQDYMRNLTKGVKLDKLTGNKAKAQEYKLGNGQTISLTPAQVMSLYLLERQQDAKDHIYVGGIKQAPTVALKGKGKRPQITRSYEVAHVTPEDVGKIISGMTDEQKRIADGIGKFFTDYTAEWGNEVSLKLYGYKKFTVENYFPIVSDRNYIDDVFGETTDMTLKNMGSTKARQKGANNPVIIEDVFDVFTRQADQMSSYNAFVIPLGDMQRVFNYKNYDGSVKQAIEKRFGTRATRYFKQLMTDINGGARYNGGSELANKLISNYKQAKLGLNLRVILQQPTAFLRAAAVMDAKYLAQAVTTKSSADMETIYKYAPIAQWKNWGFFSMDTGKRMKELVMDETTLSDYTMWAAGKMDELTWKRLWVAAELEIRDKQPDLKVGSEGYLKAVGERFSEVVDRTQVVDSVLHRSQIMRNPDGLVKMSVSFMNEPFKAYNMLRSAAVNARRNLGKAAKKALGMAVSGYLASVVVNHLITAAVDTLRGDEDDEEWLEKMVKKVLGKDDEEVEPKTWLQRYMWHFLDNLVNEPLSMLPYVKDVVSLWQGYDIKRMDMQGIGDLMNAATRAASDKYSIGMKIADLGFKAADLFGIPASSFKREVETVSKLVLGAVDSPWVDYQNAKLWNSIKSSSNRKLFLDILYKAYEDGDKETYKRIVNDMMDNGFEASDIESGMRSRAKKAGISVADIGSVDFSTGIKPKYKEETSDSKFDIDSLTPEQYLEYSEASGKLKESIIKEFQRRGFGKLDEESANNLLSAAYTYAEQTALMDAADVDIVYKTVMDDNGDEIEVAYVNIGGKLYEKEESKEWGHIADWVVKAQDADELGLTVPEWLMLREEYSGQGVSITSDGVYKAHEAGIDVENYLAFKAGTKDMDNKLDKIDFAEDMDLTDDEHNALLAHSILTSEKLSKTLKPDQYDNFAEGYADVMDKALNSIGDISDYEEKAQKSIHGYADTYATEYALGKTVRGYDRAEWVDDAVSALSAGVDLGTIFEAKYVYSITEGKKGANGKTITGSKKSAFYAAMRKMGLTTAQLNAIWKVVS